MSNGNLWKIQAFVELLSFSNEGHWVPQFAYAKVDKVNLCVYHIYFGKWKAGSNGLIGRVTKTH